MSTCRNGLSGTPDATTWSYDAQRGWLTAKQYADSGAVGYEEKGSLNRGSGQTQKASLRHGRTGAPVLQGSLQSLVSGGTPEKGSVSLINETA
jgi:hypothetical protein